MHTWLVGWLVAIVFSVPSPARSFRDAPHLLSLAGRGARFFHRSINVYIHTCMHHNCEWMFLYYLLY